MVAASVAAVVFRLITHENGEAFMQQSVPNYDLVADLKRVPWTHVDGGEGKTIDSQLIFDGADGGPEAKRPRLSRGACKTRRRTANPRWKCGSETKPREMRSEINRKGRHLHGCERDVQPEPVPGCPRATQKTLISDARGVTAKIVECPAGTKLKLDAPVYGRFELITKGSASLNGKDLGEETLRFVQSATPEAPLECGPQGATIIVLTYDDDAVRSYGGSLREDLKIILPRMAAPAPRRKFRDSSPAGAAGFVSKTLQLNAATSNSS
jgi:hypothetical protein